MKCAIGYIFNTEENPLGVLPYTLQCFKLLMQVLLFFVQYLWTGLSSEFYMLL